MITTVHQIWLGNAPFPKEMEHTASTAKSLDMEYKLWDWRTLSKAFGTFGFEALINENSDKYLWRTIARFYIWLILSKHPGYYVDADAEFKLDHADISLNFDVYFEGTLLAPTTSVIFVKTPQASKAISERIIRKLKVQLIYPSLLTDKNECAYGDRFIWSTAIPTITYKDFSWATFQEQPDIDPNKEVVTENKEEEQSRAHINVYEVPLSDLYYIPSEMEHIYILDNAAGGNLPITFNSKDCIVHINSATLKEQSIYSPASFHKLFIEYKDGGRREVPNDFNLFHSVAFTYPLETSTWLTEYRNLTKKHVPYYTVRLALELQALYKNKKITIVRDSFAINKHYTREDLQLLKEHDIDTVTIKYDLFYLITTCAAYTNRREAQQNTWLRSVSADNSLYRYILSSANFIGQDSRIWNLSQYGIDDGYNTLPKKVLYGMRKALDYSWDWLYKCDDDTYVVPNRLLQATSSTQAAFGHMLVHPTEHKKWLSGGSGYVLPRSYVKYLVEHMQELPHTGPEDWHITGHLIENGFDVVHDDRFFPYNTATPDKINQIIATHYVKPEEMYDIYNKLTHN